MHVDAWTDELMDGWSLGHRWREEGSLLLPSSPPLPLPPLSGYTGWANISERNITYHIRV